MYSKATETAFAAVGRLAEVYDGGSTLLSAKDIAQSRGLPQPFVAKVLSTLTQAELVSAVRGPGGGFTLALAPKAITLYDVYALFEQDSSPDICPFGGGICSEDDKCPLHDRLAQVHKSVDRLLHRTTFDKFRLAFRKNQGEASWQCPPRK